jgi:hypothetical protein
MTDTITAMRENARNRFDVFITPPTSCAQHSASSKRSQCDFRKLSGATLCALANGIARQSAYLSSAVDCGGATLAH